MKKLFISSAMVVMTLLLFQGCTQNKVNLFNGEDLENWEAYTEETGVDPDTIFWVEDGMIQTSGKPTGYIRTRESYRNFKLHVEWRWVEEPTNSGVLIHVQDKNRIWPHAIECQLMHEHAGDLVLMGQGAGVTVDGTEYQVTSEENRYVVIAKQQDPSENAPGEWNSYDITSLDDNIEVVVNGVIQNSGTALKPVEGNILLQSEGSPIQFRNIYLERL